MFSASRTSYSKAAPNLSYEQLRDFAYGNRVFNTNWVIAPSSTENFDGLGPLFNRVSCSACHVRDGRGQPPLGPNEPMMSMLIRLSVPGKAEDGGPPPHPVYGGQLQDRATPGTEAEGGCRVTYVEVAGKFADGEEFSLRRPRYEMINLKYGEMSQEVLYSPRVAPAVFGLGLLESVPDETLLKLADPEDKDGDGISGRVNMVWDVAQKRKAIGRFGWKANVPTLRQQTAGAFNGDMGITSSMFPRENFTEDQHIQMPAGERPGPELVDSDLDKVEFYLRTLAVPARRHTDSLAVLRGERIFAKIGCARCHVPSMVTRADAALPRLSNQRIQPFTDLLLHDMGDGLADDRPDYEADRREWRTPPLWGLGLLEAVNQHNCMLHDGRARGIVEAILWHGGEAQKARDIFVKLSKEERDALLRFLRSL